MRRVRTLWFFFVVVILLAAFYGLVAPHLYGTLLWSRLRHDSPERRASRVHAIHLFWSAALVWLFCRLGRIRIIFPPPLKLPPLLKLWRTSRRTGPPPLKLRRTGPPPLPAEPRPAIIVANHRSAFDFLLLAAVVRRLGYRRLTFVAKAEIRRVKIIGRFTREMGCAFVTRKRGAEDIARVRQCGEEAAEMGRSIVIFPEGTTWGNPLFLTPSAKTYVQVLPPKVGGIKTLVEVLPNYPVLSLTLDWRGNNDTGLRRIQTLMKLGMTIEARLVEDTHGRPTEEWLTEEWALKDERLQRTAG